MSAHQALLRATEILDFLSKQGAELSTVSDIATACNLPEASCHRLLQALKSMDWVDQSGLRKPYRLGPRAWSLTSGQAYQAALIDRVRPFAQNSAESLGHIVVLACLRGVRRQTLAWFYPEDSTRTQLLPKETEDIYLSSGGRLLLAMLSRKNRRALISELGLPGSLWPGIIDEQELHTELDSIRRQRCCAIHRDIFCTTSVLMRWPRSSEEACSLGTGTEHYALGCFGYEEKDGLRVRKLLQSTVSRILQK